MKASKKKNPPKSQARKLKDLKSKNDPKGGMQWGLGAKTVKLSWIE
jgi:hypothetical protein